MNSEEYSENICQAIDVIVKKALSSLSFNITIKGNIVAHKNNSSEYTVRSMDKVFKAYSDLDYDIGERVYVVIPNADYSERKFIIGRGDN